MKRKQREIINSLDVHFKRDNQTQDAFILKTIEEVRVTTQAIVKNAGAKGAILGLSGGLDSFVVGAILAGIKEPDFKLTLVAMPQGSQHDYDDVIKSINAIHEINPNVEFFEANIGTSVRALHQEVNATDSDITLTSTALGNVAARMRMVMQYALASNQLVVGTDHATEAVVGYYTKYGDGGADYMPIAGLLKDDLYVIAEKLGAPDCILTKKPAAGLGITSCDEDELGLNYIRDIAPYLRGENIHADKIKNIIKRYDATRHKREIPTGVYTHFDKAFPPRMTHVVIDCCHDFIDGTLACLHAKEAVKNIADEINDNPYTSVLYVQEKHPANHCSFKEQGGEWPPHCVENTWGTELSPLFDAIIFKNSNTPIKDFNVFYKGVHADTEQYSGYHAFSYSQGYVCHNCEDTVMISGIATEYCIKNTVMDFIEDGFNVIIKEKCLGYVDKNEHDKTLKELISLGVTVIYN